MRNEDLIRWLLVRFRWAGDHLMRSLILPATLIYTRTEHPPGSPAGEKNGGDMGKGCLRSSQAHARLGLAGFGAQRWLGHACRLQQSTPLSTTTTPNRPDLPLDWWPS